MRIGAAVAAVVLCGVITACSHENDRAPTTDYPPAPGAEDWADLGLPYGRQVDGVYGSYHLGYRDASVVVDIGGPTGSPEDPPYDDAPDRFLRSTTATASAAFFTFSPRGEELNEVWMLTADGAWVSVGESVYGVAIADIRSETAFWTEQTGTGYAVLSYDSETGESTRLDFDDEALVTRVDGHVAFGGSAGETWTWDGQGDPVPRPVEVTLARDGVGALRRVEPTDSLEKSEWLDAAGEVVRTTNAVAYAAPSPNGEFVLVRHTYGDGWSLRQFPSGEVVELGPSARLPRPGSSPSPTWAADGRLVLETAWRTILCAVPERECTEISERDGGNGDAFAQIVATEPTNDDSE